MIYEVYYQKIDVIKSIESYYIIKGMSYMNNKCICWLSILFVFEQQYMLSMENMRTSQQKMVTVQCSDNKNYSLAQWKVFESIPFHMYFSKKYPRFQLTDVVIKLPSTINISYEKMDLFSKALDKAFLSKAVDGVSEEFKQYVNNLMPQEKRLLIIAAGRFDEKGRKQLYSPMLISQLVDVCFDFEKDFLKKHIKPLLQKDNQEEYYISKIIDYNLRNFHFQDISSSHSYVIHSNERGRMSKVPSCLAVEAAMSDNQVSDFIDQKCVDNVLRRVFYSKNVGNWHYYVTDRDQQQEKLGNELLLWSINNNKRTWTTVNVSNNHDIVEFNGLPMRCDFNKNGTYLVVWSINDVFVTKILRQDDGSSLFNTQQICRNVINIIDINFYNDDTQLIVCSFDDIKKSCGKLYLFNITGEYIKSIFINGVPYTSIENKKGLLLFSFLDTKDFSCRNRCNLINDDMEMCQENLYTKCPEKIRCSSDKNHCAILAEDGAISLITAHEMASHVQNLLIGQNKKKMLFSSDSRFLIVLERYTDCKYGDRPERYTIDVWSTATGEKRSSVKIPSQVIDLQYTKDCNAIFSFGLTPKDHNLVIYAENDRLIYSIPFFSQQDQSNICFLNDASVTVLAILRRLYMAHKKGDNVVLYEEEPAYKILQALNKPDFIKKCLCFNVINNKNMISFLYDKSVEVIQKLWK